MLSVNVVQIASILIQKPISRMVFQKSIPDTVALLNVSVIGNVSYQNIRSLKHQNQRN